MKALPCPGCGAPITVKQGLASMKCSFCDLEVKPDFEATPEFSGLDEKQLTKLKRRAFDSLKRDLIDKASLQFETLAELLSTNIDDEYIDIQAKSYAVKLRAILYPAYNLTNGTTLVGIKNESTYADVSAPAYSYVRVDAPMIDLIDEIEDKCDILDKDMSIKLARKSFSNLYTELEELIIPATNYIFEEASFTETEEYGEFGNWISRVALPEPVYVGIKIRCEMYSMLIKFIEHIDLDEEEENPTRSLQVHKDTSKYALSDINLHHIKLTDRHPYQPYNYKFILPHSDVVKETYEAWLKLDNRVRPILSEIERKKKEEEEKIREAKRIEDEKRRIEEEKIREAKRIEDERKRKEWLASPEYKAQKEQQKKILIRTSIGLLILIPTLLIFSLLSKDNNDKSNSEIYIEPKTLDSENNYQ